MKIAATVPRHGDFYPTVRAWMQRLKLTELDILANSIKMTSREAIVTLVHEVVGKPYPQVTFRKLPSHIGLGGAQELTFDREYVDGGRMTLGTVLHEIAHCLVSRRAQAAAVARRKRHLAFQPRARAQVSWKDANAHGELFCLTYGRLLRQELGQQGQVAAQPRLNGIEQVLAELAQKKDV